MGYEGSILSKDIKAEDGKVKDGETVYRLLTTMLDKNDIPYENSGYYVYMIDGQKSNDRGQYSGWSYAVNDVSASIGMNKYTLKEDDIVNVFFTADFSNPFRDIDSIVLDKSDIDLTVGDTQKLAATVAPGNATEALAWTSDNPDVAAVDADGNVTAKGTGTAIITVKPQYNTHAQPVKCIVVVNAK